MGLLEQAVVAVLAAVGVVSLAWDLVGHRILHGREQLETCVVLLPVAGEAPALERTVQELLSAKVGGNRFRKILIADCGLSEEARTIARLLAAEHETVVLCHAEEAEQQLAAAKMR